MKLSVEFPSVAYREGPEAVARLAAAIEAIGYDHIDVFDHVVMPFPAEGRPAPAYPPRMPVLEAFATLTFLAAVTKRVGLGTEILVLPQRQPLLVAKQVSTLDMLSGGRVRLGVAAGWQASEFEALGENFGDRGRRLDEAISLLRACWADEQIDFDGTFYRVSAMAMEPKPPQGGGLPIWVGGSSPQALQRVARLGDGWLAGAEDPEIAAAQRSEIARYAEVAGRDPATISAQLMLNMPPRIAGKRDFYSDRDAVLRRVGQINALEFEWVSLNATEIFQAGARSVDAMVEKLGELFAAIRSEVGASG